jgi:putative two-component system response regulator
MSMLELIDEAARRAAQPKPEHSAWFEDARLRLLANDGEPGEDLTCKGFRAVMVHFYNKGQFNAALELGLHGIALSDAHGWKRGQRLFHHLTAVLFKGIGDTGRAVSHLAEAVVVAKEIGDRDGECRAWGQLASTVLHDGDFEKVIDYARKGLATASTIVGENAPHDLKAQCNHLIGEACLHLAHDPTKQSFWLGQGIVAMKHAITELQEPTEVFQKIQANKMHLTEVQLYSRGGKVAEAASAAAKCRELAVSINHEGALLNSDIADALVGGASGDSATALQRLRPLSHGKRLNDAERGDVVSAMAFIFDRVGDKSNAEQSRRDLYKLYQRQNIANAYRIIDQIAAQYTVDEAAALNAATVEAMEIMALVGELHDDDTGAHVYRVGAMTRFIALELGLDAETAEHLDVAARLHDIGKVGIHSDIMQKPGSLSRAERTIMMEHAAIGAEILMRMSHPLMVIAAQIAGSHHERWDGEGYPAGRIGDGIPLAARITSVADVFDALTHARAYKHAWRTDDAIAEIKRGRGSAFDPTVVDAFLIVVERLVEEHGDEGIDAVLSKSSQENALVVARAFLRQQVNWQAA